MHCYWGCVSPCFLHEVFAGGEDDCSCIETLPIHEQMGSRVLCKICFSASGVQRVIVGVPELRVKSGWGDGAEIDEAENDGFEDDGAENDGAGTTEAEDGRDGAEEDGDGATELESWRRWGREGWSWDDGAENELGKKGRRNISWIVGRCPCGQMFL